MALKPQASPVSKTWTPEDVSEETGAGGRARLREAPGHASWPVGVPTGRAGKGWSFQGSLDNTQSLQTPQDEQPRPWMFFP